MGYRVTACDLAEEMIAVARRSDSATAVKWVCLEPDWAHISILNSTDESSDVGRHQYLCGFERNEGAPEDDT
jgi:2-polyprenyl-3-methyl-5-hydroxy-6-metoxy-1,4-benzoquinol methylase